MMIYWSPDYWYYWQNRPPPDSRFWRGIGVATVICTLFWAGIILLVW